VESAIGCEQKHRILFLVLRGLHSFFSAFVTAGPSLMLLPEVWKCMAVLCQERLGSLRLLGRKEKALSLLVLAKQTFEAVIRQQLFLHV
jgi:hypothetical protein